MKNAEQWAEEIEHDSRDASEGDYAVMLAELIDELRSRREAVRGR